MRIVKIVAIVVAVVVVVGLVTAALTMDWMVKKGVEVGGTAALGTKTTLGSASVHIFSGGLSMSALTVSNPTGYQTPEAITMEKGSVEVGLGSLMSDTVMVNDITIEKPVLTIERKGSTTNLNEILANLGAGPKEKTKAAPAKGKGYHIKHILIKGAVANFLVAGEKPITVTLPDIELKDLGTGENNSVQLAGVVSVVMLRLAQETVTQAAGKVPGEMVNMVGGGVQAAQKTLAGAADALGKGVGDAVKSLPPLPKLPDIKLPEPPKLPDIKLPKLGG